MTLVASLGLRPKRIRRGRRLEPAPAIGAAKIKRRQDTSHQELLFRFVWWAHQLREFPSVQQIRDRFEVSRATAYRWRDSLAAAHGINTPVDPSTQEGIE
ncbi:hypothetical protein [Lysobacter capsici]|uniref:hypothetical protein n=1 Tax=Lysobacter capsici TaxID=435897 RepID=UPI0007164D7E|nr:hypothetical protein [Lysobacter capsici]